DKIRILEDRMTTIDRLLAEAMEAELAWREECLRRAAKHDADPESSLSWDDAMETIFTTIKQ
ncbi:MAG: hypothetical protein ABI305_06555, partial [Tepidiformaceae bacterium]